MKIRCVMAKTWTARVYPRLCDSNVSRRFGRTANFSESSDGQNKATGVVFFWPKDLLPEDCPDCRILTWDYETHDSRFLGGAANQNGFFDHAKNLLYAIDRERFQSVGLFVSKPLSDCYNHELLLRVCLSARASNRLCCTFFGRYIPIPTCTLGSQIMSSMLQSHEGTCLTSPTFVIANFAYESLEDYNQNQPH